MDLGQVFTKSSVAEYMAALFNLKNDATILDPCFGDGSFFKALQKQGYTDITGYEIDEKLYKKNKLKWRGIELYNSDFLFNNSSETFDGIIMNPPYIRQEKIDDLKSFGITKDRLRADSLFRDLPSTANIYMYFIIKAISMLKDDGEMVVIFPNSWTSSKSGELFKRILFEQCTLLKQVHLFGDLFEKKALVDVFVLHLKKGIFISSTKFESYNVSAEKFIEDKVYNSDSNLGYFNSFKSYGTVRRGLTTGFNSMYINPNFIDSKSLKFVDKILSTPKAVTGYSAENSCLDDIFIPKSELPMPNEVFEYLEFNKKQIIQSKSPKTLYTKIQKGNKEWYKIVPFDSTGIIFNYFVRNEMKFILNKSHLVRDNFYIIKPKINIDLMFALLNNYYTYYQLEKNGKKYGAGLLKLQRYDIESIKFPNIDDFSLEDTKKLCSLSKKLYTSGDTKNIERITKIISKYSLIDFKSIENYLHLIKNNRLKGENHDS
ncbi:TPA: N-6 DNA methylase [Streptococcus pyogenes]|uniref:HsdM family class I SAM-dependent methyltransferase n=1 Tax=Lactococcus garvieae TaxID=1363 RepID=UPI002549C408|nr:N-6 DNA methylase [Lactococcus garvieae]